MKLTLSSFVAFSLLGSLAGAFSAVGDYAEYDLVKTENGKTTNGVIIREITAFNPVNQSYTTHISTHYDQAALEERDVITGEVAPKAKIADLLTNCVAKSGKLEALTTPAGTFNTCSIPVVRESYTGTDWIADVPFGLVKFTATATNGTTITATLRSVAKPK